MESAAAGGRRGTPRRRATVNVKYIFFNTDYKTESKKDVKEKKGTERAAAGGGGQRNPREILLAREPRSLFLFSLYLTTQSSPLRSSLHLMTRCVPSGASTAVGASFTRRSSWWRLLSSTPSLTAATPSTKMRATVGPKPLKGEISDHQAREAYRYITYKRERKGNS
jgi:hypothetical protein